MSETKDPAIKLFGKTIPLPETPPPPLPVSDSNRAGEYQDCDEAPSREKQIDDNQEDESNLFTSEEMTGDQNETSLTNDNPKTPTADDESQSSKTPSEEEQNETTNSQNKTLKKPDKILPCPRCNSMDTKFCYYNNYNVTQPRHFCKNCHRYWTAGGTMRNVPVGAGRRKNKNSASHFRHVTISEALQSTRINLPNGAHYPTVKPNGTVLTFGSDTLLCDSMKKTIRNCAQNGFHKPENLKMSIPCRGGEANDDQSTVTSVIAGNVKDESINNGPNDILMQNCHSYPAQLPVYAGPSWPYPLNMPQWVSPPGVYPPGPPGYPMPFYPAPPYWGCAIQPPWTVPWVPIPLNATPNSPTLGKHSRDENPSKQSDLREEEEKKRESGMERSLWIPKTLRIDDPGEAARSSIWTTLGFKHEICDSGSERGGKGSLFKAFQSKAGEKNDSSDALPVLQANPAAFSRSQNFQESS